MSRGEPTKTIGHAKARRRDALDAHIAAQRQYRDQEAIRLIVARFLRSKGYLAK
jgi:hypothetical protein